jgi:Fe-S-cluster-containing dehydrogenase component
MPGAGAAGAAAPDRAAFVFDAARCTGCGACALACTIENRLDWGRSWRQIVSANPAHRPDAPAPHLSMACNHCERAPCMEACPALAYRRDAATGAVLIDPDRCIGCRYCAWACPYDAPRFDARAGIMTKCTFCAHRLREGRAPACASLCPTGALTFAFLPAAALTQDFPGLPGPGLGPSLRVTGAGGATRAAVPSWTRAAATAHDAGVALGARAAGAGDAVLGAPAPHRVDLREEWSLLAFTTLAALLVALAWAAGLGAAAPSPWGFATLAVLAMALGGAHLGRPGRAWRAVLNLRSSWLSREVALFGAFAAAGTAWFAAGAPPAAAAWVGALGLALAVAVDRVYRYAVLPAHATPHSASAVLMAAALAGVVAASAPVALAACGAQAVLFARRVLGACRAGEPVRPAPVALRALLGFAAPLALWSPAGTPDHALMAAAVLAGQARDRADFYLGLGFHSPQRGLTAALRERVAAAVRRAAA